MLLSTASYQVIAIEPGKLTGGVNFETPDWFKDSFLEIASDVEEASEVGKHVLLFSISTPAPTAISRSINSSRKNR